MAASADHLKAFVKAHATGDEEGFYAVALQMAAKAARQGNNRPAAELQDLIDRAKAEQVPERVSPTRSSGRRVSWPNWSPLSIRRSGCAT